MGTLEMCISPLVNASRDTNALEGFRINVAVINGPGRQTIQILAGAIK